ncbi:MAG TPA: P-loop NTPase [Armatimonadota bacterium]|jgi:ATP-binding protein involved in chromosome partitioning
MSETREPTQAVSEAQVLDALKVVMDPDLQRDIVTLGFVKNVRICGDSVALDIELTTPACPVKEQLKQQAVTALKELPGVATVSVNMTSNVSRRAGGPGSVDLELLKGVRNIVAVASGKGGVGKSTVSVNLALALAQSGAKVGLMDSDIYGPTIPRMLGIEASAEATEENHIVPLERYGIRLMSMAFLTGNDTPTIWRGPMVSRLVQQFLSTVEWGELDYLVIDLPPGTGDIQLTLTQTAPLNGAVIVTTPQDVAVGIARKGLRMFQQVNVPVLGLVENMSTFVCPHCNTPTRLFPHGGAEATCEEMGIPLLAEIPFDPELAMGGDLGEPIVLRDPGSPAALAFQEAAKNMAAQLSIVNLATARVTSVPTEVQALNDHHLSIHWDDGHQSIFSFRKLRAACPCASCVDEWTGERRVELADVPEDVFPEEIQPVGRYALHLRWSDGHSSGIYSFDLLRGLCECPSCQAAH